MSHATLEKVAPVNETAQKGLLEFYMADFKDLSDKLEKTDGKIQFFVQLYIGIITASIALLSEKLMLAGHYLFSGLFWAALGSIGFFVMQYVTAGIRIHYNYVNRLNFLRSTILKQLGMDLRFIHDYDYTKPIRHKTNGMNYWLIYFLIFAVTVFYCACAACLVLYEGYLLKDTLSAVVVVFLFVASLIYCLVGKNTLELMEKGEKLVAAYEKEFEEYEHNEKQ